LKVVPSLLKTLAPRRALAAAAAVAVAVAAALPARASAQAPPPPPPTTTQSQDSARADAVLRLGELRVHGARAGATVGGTSALEVNRDSMRLSPAPTLEEVLREVPLLHVRRNSRGEAEVLARGSESRQVAVLVDGIPLNMNWDARADVSVIPATAVGELRFTRGLASMLHGPNVLGGVIEMEIAGEHAEPPTSLTLSSGLDHAGGMGATAAFTLPLETGHGSLLLRGGAGYRDTPGLPLPRGVLEPVPASRSGLRLNTDSRSADAFAAARYRGGNGAWLSASTSSSTGERGVAAELDATTPRFWRYPHISRTIAVLSGGTGFHGTPFGGTGDLEFSVGYDVGRTEILAYRDRSYAESTAFDDGDDRTLTLRLLGDHTLGRRGDLRAAFTLADVRHDEALPGGTFRYRQRLWSGGAETVWQLGGRGGTLRDVRASFGGALDGAANLLTGDKPGTPDIQAWGARAGLSAVLGGSVGVHAGGSRRGRFPALRESFSGALNRFAPNPELGPEYLTALEAGATAYLGDVHFQAVAFLHRLDDAIVRVALPDGRFMRVNENATRSRGMELLAAWALSPGTTIGGDLAVQSARLVTPSLRRGRLENQPEVAGSLRARTTLPLGIAAGAQAEFTGRQFCLASTGDDVELAAGTRVGGELRRQWALRRSPAAVMRRLEARLGVENAGDAAIYDQCGLPQPGRIASLQFRIF
jgi:iron complex outermembrane recepter protein